MTLENYYGVNLKEAIGDKADLFSTAQEAKANGRNPNTLTNVLGNVIQTRVIAALKSLVQQSLADVLMEYEVLNGERPADGDLLQHDWDAGLEAEVEAVFEPYIEHLSGAWLASVWSKHSLSGPGGVDSAAQRFALELWANGPGRDMPAVMLELGIKPVELDALEAESPTAPVPARRGRRPKATVVVSENPGADAGAALSAGLGAIQTLVNAYQPWSEGYDATVVYDALGAVLALPPGTEWIEPGLVDDIQALAAVAPPPWESEPVAYLMDLFNRAPWPQGGSVLGRASDTGLAEGTVQIGVIDSHGARDLASARATVPAAADVGPGTDKRNRSKPTEPDQAPLIATMMAANITEHEIAAAIGVSRATVNNYHHGKARWTPDAECRTRVAQLLVMKVNEWDGVLLKLGYQQRRFQGSSEPYSGPEHLG